MHFKGSMIAAMLGASLVAGCGGGGGGAGASTAAVGNPGGGTVPAPPPTQPVVPDGSWLTLTPNTVALKNYHGESARFTIKATSTRSFDKPFNVAVIDKQGLITPQVSISKQTDLEYVFGLQTNELAPGSYANRLEVRLCEDDPAVCAKPLPGSPWYVPLTVEVASAAQAQERLTMSPAAVAMVAYENEAAAMQLGIKVNTEFDVPVSVAVFDNAGVLAPDILVSKDSRSEYRARLISAASLARGEHTTTLEVRLCYDDARTCKSPVVGSPWRVPVKVTVKPGTNLTALTAIPGLAPWSNEDGNAARTAYAAASFDPAHFTRRWSKPAASLILTSAPVIVNGKLFMVRGNRFSSSELVAIDEASGEILWTKLIGSGVNVSTPAAVNGKLFVHLDGDLIATFVYDQETGERFPLKMMSSYSNCRVGPTAAGAMVYSGVNRISKFDPAANALVWNSALVDSDLCAPSVDGSLAYAYSRNRLHALATADGSLAYTITDPVATSGNSVGVPVVLGDGMGFVIDGKRLSGFNLGARSRAWVAEGAPVGQPVFANGIVYALAENGIEVEARAAATGVVQWKSAGLNKWSLYTPYEHMAVTSNLLFVSGPTATVAIDLATRQVAWSYPLGGELAISDRGVLYIFAKDGKQAAINLR